MRASTISRRGDLMYIIILFLMALLLYNFLPLRIAFCNPISTIRYGVVDLFNFFTKKKWRLLEGGTLNCYGAHFGGGKTLTMAHFITELYNRYNNVKVWDRGRKKFVTQKIHIISNFELLSVPFERLDSLSQVVACAKYNKDVDELNDTRTVTMVCIDEASVQLNSRNFKNNIDASFLNTLLTCRHYHINIWYSSQKFKLTDALMRSVTQRYIECSKMWRFMCLREYNADEVELASDTSFIQPIRKYGFFVKDSDYNSYDTLACVDALEKSVKEGDMLSEKDILELRGELNPNNDAISKRSWKMKARKKR